MNAIDNKLKAEDYFHKKPERFNCAQAVLKAFQKDFNISEDMVNQFNAFGGGRAPEGYCGALYAALCLKITKEVKSQIESDFVETAKFVTCKEIRTARTISCKECVRLAEELVCKSLELEAIES